METRFDIPSSVLFGAGSRLRLSEELKKLGAARVLLVTDQRLRDTETMETLRERLADDGVAATIFSEVQPDPTDRNVLVGLDCLRNCNAEAIVAVGGGSVMDAAKIIGVAATNSEPLASFQGYHRIPKAGLPLIALPTTAGTGSEATKVAVITDTERHVKMMIYDPKILPRVAIVDYELSLTMPATLTAYVGVDTLVHGMEAYVSRKASGMTDPLALSCIQLTSKYLRTAQKEPDNRKAREAMALAACQGGMAFSNSSVCLVHGMSRPIGAVFHLPHGLSNAVLLPAVTRFSIPGAPERYARIRREMGWDEDLGDGLERLNAELGIPKLRDALGISRDKFETHLKKMADDALASGSPQNNPIVPSVDEIVDLYRRAW
ncbi:MAG TPA: iron-containing alcohol dehydrogenase [Bryobacteraceae bacterium]|jgi:alcohol dehydrogenase class IV